MISPGKQLVSMILKNLVRIYTRPDCKIQPVFHTNKPKTPGDMWNGLFDKNKEEELIRIRGSDLLTGVMDKSEFGASGGGLIHLCYEMYGSEMAGAALSR